MQECARRLREAGCTRWCLNVKPENRPAVRLYESLGLRLAHASSAVRVRWEQIEAFPPARGRVVAVTREDAPLLERAFGLATGLLHKMLAQARVLRVARDDRDVPIGLACFAPDFPGCFPFRAADARVARALLEALVPHRRQAHCELQLVIEDSPALVGELERLGARIVLDFVHYRGAL